MDTIMKTPLTKWVLLFAFATIVAYLLSTLAVFWTRWQAADHIPVEMCTEVVAEKRSEPVRPLDYFSRIWDRNLFNVKIEEDLEDPAKKLLAQIDQLSLTTLNCNLIGTIIHEGKTSWAIIKDNQSGKEEKVQVGDKIKGAEVVMILRNKVVLNINGENQLLIMGIEKIRAENRKSTEGGEANTPVDVETYNISKDFITDSVNNIPQIMATVRVKPYFEDGRPAGFHVSNIKDESILKTMGFKDGDIIKSVNGREIKTTQDVMTLYNALKDSNFFGIGIIRSGQRKTLNFKVR